MNLQEQIKAHKELSLKIEQLEQEKKALGMAIMRQMQDKSLRVSNFIVRRFMRLSFKVSIEDARALKATKMEEIVDKDKLKALYSQNPSLKGVSEVHYIQISELVSL